MKTAESFIAVVAQQGADFFCDMVVIDAQARFAYWTLQTNGTQTVLCGEHSFILFNRDVVKTFNILVQRHPFSLQTIISLVLFDGAFPAGRDASVMECIDLDSTRRGQWSELDKRKNFSTVVAALLNTVTRCMSLAVIMARQEWNKFSSGYVSPVIPTTLPIAITYFSWSTAPTLAITRLNERQLNVTNSFHKYLEYSIKRGIK
jgi:hypothetical protein